MHYTFHTFLSLSPPKKQKKQINSLRDFLPPNEAPETLQSNIYQVPVPPDLVHKTYEDIFLHFAINDQIALGLYREMVSSCDLYLFFFFFYEACLFLLGGDYREH